MEMLKDDNKKASVKRWLSAIIIAYVILSGLIEQICDKPLNITLISLLMALVTGMLIGTIYEKK